MADIKIAAYPPEFLAQLRAFHARYNAPDPDDRPVGRVTEKGRVWLAEWAETDDDDDEGEPIFEDTPAEIDFSPVVI